jgi:hypothetical protein
MILSDIYAASFRFFISLIWTSFEDDAYLEQCSFFYVSNSF